MRPLAAVHRRVLPAFVAAVVATAGAAYAAHSPAQGFLRVVEGRATLVRVEDGRAEPARPNAPALPGDRLYLEPGARVELVLPDGQRVRLGEEAALELVSLAGTLDGDDAATVLALEQGALALAVPEEPVEPTFIETDAARVTIRSGGSYLVEVDRAGTRVVVRDGEAELASEREATWIESGEEAVVDAYGRRRLAVGPAPRLAPVELWAGALEAEAAGSRLGPIDPALRYAALPMERHGSWFDTTAGRAWRPRVEAGWRPYWDGYWTYSAAGLVWSSNEPWGWVPYHYGWWDLHPSYGWVWYPGAVYAPAHVVWYWGSPYTAWIPTGYYRSYYARGFGVQLTLGSTFFGFSWADRPAYRDWVFCPTGSLGFRDQAHHHRDHRSLDRGWDQRRRGFVTTDTRGLEARRWRDSGAAQDELVRHAHRRAGGEGQLRDLSAVLARSPEVTPTLLRELERRDQQVDDTRAVALRRPASERTRPATATEGGSGSPPSSRLAIAPPQARDERLRRIEAEPPSTPPAASSDAGRMTRISRAPAPRRPAPPATASAPPAVAPTDRAGIAGRPSSPTAADPTVPTGAVLRRAVPPRSPAAPEAGEVRAYRSHGVQVPASPRPVEGAAVLRSRPTDRGAGPREAPSVRRMPAAEAPEATSPRPRRLPVSPPARIERPAPRRPPEMRVAPAPAPSRTRPPTAPAAAVSRSPESRLPARAPTSRIPARAPSTSASTPGPAVRSGAVAHSAAPSAGPRAAASSPQGSVRASESSQGGSRRSEERGGGRSSPRSRNAGPR